MHGPVVSFAYYASWAAYGRAHYPWDVPACGVTHVTYAFARVHPERLTAELSDAWIDVEKVYAEQGDASSVGEATLHGNLGRLLALKRARPGLKVGIALGGWKDSAHLSDAMLTDERRANLAASLVDMAQDYCLDYVDIDWEFPEAGGLEGNSHSPHDRANLIALAHAIHSESDRRGLSLFLTAAVPAVTAALHGFDLGAMAAVFRYVLVMAYDMCGAWAPAADHHANLQARDGRASSAADAVAFIQARGVPASQVVLGVPLYGRSYAGCAGLGQPFSGPGPGPDGVLDLRALPLPGSVLHWDAASLAAYSHDPASQVLVSHESADSIRCKMDYVEARGLAGLMAWETSGDHPCGDERSYFAMVERRFGARLDRTPAAVCSASSRFANVRSHSTLSPKAAPKRNNEDDTVQQ